MTSRTAFFFALVLSSAPVDATDFVVTTAVDALDAGAVRDGICDTGAGQCSLRAAIQEANAAADPDTITVPAGTYSLTVDDPDDGHADLDLTNPATITGAGPLATIVSGNGLHGVFEIQDSATIVGLTIRDGGQEFSGGGVYAVPAANLTLVIRDAQITGNTANHGGGLYVDGGAVVTLERVSITGNTGTVSGGALEIGTDFGGGTVTLRNATVSGNTTGLDGGIVTGTSGDSLMLDHVTLVGSTIGGGGTTTIVGSILDAGPGGIVCAPPGTFISQGTNFERGTSCGFAMAGDMSGIDAQLALLQDNGGGTLTHALAPTSPAIDAGGTCGLAEDQRGTARPLDGDGSGGAACDVGAYELDPANPPSTTTTTSTPTTTTLLETCPGAISFDTIRCLVAALAGRVGQAGTPGTFRDRLVASLGRAGDRVDAAEGVAGSSAKKARKLLTKGSKLVKKVRAKIGSRKGRQTFPEAVERGGLQTDADALRNAMAMLAGTLG